MAGAKAQRGRADTEEREPLGALLCNVANDPPDEVVAEVVVRVEQLVRRATSSGTTREANSPTGLLIECTAECVAGECGTRQHRRVSHVQRAMPYFELARPRYRSRVIFLPIYPGGS